MAYVKQVKTQMGFMNVSSSDLTALDLVLNEEKVGGLSRVAEVLIELAENMHFDESNAEMLDFFNAPVIQRLGYLLDLIEEHKLGDRLLMLAQKREKIFRKIRLKQSKPHTDDMAINSRWKVIINQEIETDEI
jgi:predicted transcriptional regulator of viral defense system